MYEFTNAGKIVIADAFGRAHFWAIFHDFAPKIMWTGERYSLVLDVLAFWLILFYI